MFGTLLIIIITYMKADILKPSRQTILREAKDYVMTVSYTHLCGRFSSETGNEEFGNARLQSVSI